MIPIDALIYDLDGTLIDSRLDIANAVNVALTDAGRPTKPVELIGTYIGDGIDQMLSRAFDHPPPAVLARALTALRAHYRRHCLEHTRLYPGVLATLEHFRDKGQAVVSNKPEDFTRIIVTGLGLDPFFPVVLGGDSTPSLKPDPTPVLAALAKLGVTAARAVMVGDGLPDLEAGRRAGLRTCAVTYGLGNPAALVAARPDHVIGSFSELTALFA